MEVNVAAGVPWNELMLQDSLQGSMEVFIEFIKQGQMNSRDHMGSTLLHLVARSGNVEKVEKLLEHGASTFLKDLHGLLPLHVASIHGHAKIVQLLLNKGCDVNVSSDAKLTPLHCAAQNGKSEVVRLLLQNGASLDPQNCYSQTPLMLAVCESHEEVVRLLVEAGSDLFVRDKTSMSIFHLAVVKSSSVCLQILLEKVKSGRLLDLTNIHGMSPFHSALMKLINQRDSYNEMLEKLKMLIKAGTSPRPQQVSRSFHMKKSAHDLQTLVMIGNVDAVSLILQVNSRKNIHKEVSSVSSELNGGRIQSASKDMAGLLQSYVSNVDRLQHLCRMVIRDNMDPGNQNICQLPLPQNLKNYVAFSDLC